MTKDQIAQPVPYPPELNPLWNQAERILSNCGWTDEAIRGMREPHSNYATALSMAKIELDRT